MKNSKINFFFILFISLLTCIASPVHAATVSVTAAENVTQGDTVPVTIYAETDGILINSAEVNIQYDPNSLLFTGYTDNNSVIKLWIDPPHDGTDAAHNSGIISFSGILPGGADGVYDANKKELGPLPLVTLLFIAKNSGTTNISILDSKILQHDGEGTPLPHTNISGSITIKFNPNYVPTPQDNSIKSATNPTENASPLSSHTDFLFWIIISILFSGILGYKLIKYRA